MKARAVLFSDANDRPVYDLLIVDAPATGHGLTFLDVPRVVQRAVRAGPLSRHASWVESLVHDHERTLMLPVTLPEDLPVLETQELIDRFLNLALHGLGSARPAPKKKREKDDV